MQFATHNNFQLTTLISTCNFQLTIHNHLQLTTTFNLQLTTYNNLQLSPCNFHFKAARNGSQFSCALSVSQALLRKNSCHRHLSWALSVSQALLRKKGSHRRVFMCQSIWWRLSIMHALCAFSTRCPKVAKRGQSARSGTQVRATMMLACHTCHFRETKMARSSALCALR